MENDWKKRLGVVYSTNPDFKYPGAVGGEKESIPVHKQKLTISLDRKNRKGKSVTLISGFIGNEEELKELGKTLKNRCGVGGSIKEGEILLQGDHRETVIKLLGEKGFQTKKSGG